MHIISGLVQNCYQKLVGHGQLNHPTATICGNRGIRPERHGRGRESRHGPQPLWRTFETLLRVHGPVLGKPFTLGRPSMGRSPKGQQAFIRPGAPLHGARSE